MVVTDEFANQVLAKSCLADDHLMYICITQFLDHYIQNPCVSGSDARDLVRSLPLVHRYIVDLIPTTDGIHIQFVELVSRLMKHCSSTVRRLLQESGILGRRDKDVIRLLGTNMDESMNEQFLTSFRFEEV